MFESKLNLILAILCGIMVMVVVFSTVHEHQRHTAYAEACAAKNGTVVISEKSNEDRLCVKSDSFITIPKE